MMEPHNSTTPIAQWRNVAELVAQLHNMFGSASLLSLSRLFRPPQPGLGFARLGLFSYI